MKQKIIDILDTLDYQHKDLGGIISLRYFGESIMIFIHNNKVTLHASNINQDLTVRKCEETHIAYAQITEFIVQACDTAYFNYVIKEV